MLTLFKSSWIWYDRHFHHIFLIALIFLISFRYWLSVGAQPSEPVQSLLLRAGLLPPSPMEAMKREGADQNEDDGKLDTPSSWISLLFWYRFWVLYLFLISFTIGFRYISRSYIFYWLTSQLKGIAAMYLEKVGGVGKKIDWSSCCWNIN